MAKVVQQDIEDIDVLIVGGGLIGMALMHALRPLGLCVRLVEARAVAHNKPSILETRSIALSPASIRILKQLDVWGALDAVAAPIETIHISEQGRFGQACLNADSKTEPLGAVVEMHLLDNALRADLNQQDCTMPAKVVELDARAGLVTIQTETTTKRIRASWVVAADGADSSVRRLCHVSANYKQYSEHALAANVALSRPHHQVAYERFTPDGPLALLPLRGEHMALVWTRTPAEVEALKQMEETVFLSTLQRAFGYRAGRFTRVGPRMTYPLKQVTMQKKVYESVVFVGNAAQTLHPVAGQGFNLGLRDVAMLAQCAAKYGLNQQALANYQSLRQADSRTITAATDGLVSLFKSNLPGVGLARRMGLVMLDNNRLLKNTILRHAKGFGGVIPDLVCGISLDVSREAY
ncbi:MAG: FAD-dependent monooxygenase [Legionellaceae bacterium]|nr:FAD-dependent monooxygenase [Legionellaceae bacterium]